MQLEVKTTLFKNHYRMKKIYLLLSVTIFLVGVTHAQDKNKTAGNSDNLFLGKWNCDYCANSKKQDTPKRYMFGLYFGINNSFFNSGVGEYGDDESSGYSNFIRISPFIGLRSIVKLTEVVSFQSEILFSSRGGSYIKENKSVAFWETGKFGNEKVYYFVNYRLDYLEFPLLLNFNMSKIFGQYLNNDVNTINPRKKITVAAGIAPSFNVGSSIRYNNFGEGNRINERMVEVKENYYVEKFDYANRFVVNSIIDIGYNIPTKYSSTMVINLRWTQTTDNVYSLPELDGYNMRTDMSTVTVGICVLY